MNADSTANREFTHSRLINAAQAQVFRAFSAPERLARWWGPDGFTNTFDTFELKLNGVWRFVMHAPDGANYPNECIFREVEAPSRIVIEHLSEIHHFFLTISFEDFQDKGNQTLVSWRQVFDSAEHREKIAAIVQPANEQNLDRLAAEVARGKPQGAQCW